MPTTYQQLIRRLVDNEPRSGYDIPARLEWSAKLTTEELRCAMDHHRGDLDCCSDIDDRFIEPAIFAHTDIEFRLAAVVLVNHLRDVYRARVLRLVWSDTVDAVIAQRERNSIVSDVEYDPDCAREEHFWEQSREVTP